MSKIVERNYFYFKVSFNKLSTDISVIIQDIM